MLIKLLQRKQLIALILSAVFLLLQTSAQLHATEHHFHTTDEICSTYKSVENHSSGCISHNDFSFDWVIVDSKQAQPKSYLLNLNSYRPQQTRAPPYQYL